MAEKVRVTVVMEYAPDLDNYPDCRTVADAAEFDERENPFLAFPDVYLDDVQSVTFEAVPA
ncbi:hypothetical protein ACFYW9_19450 [Streptomyces sp. NPDC002698]|uniref:hypothetical protein n=1 Tax=Streptomyces sp. NPDC002698 TaxID=3364660 RepID=UPI00367E02B8